MKCDTCRTGWWKYFTQWLLISSILDTDSQLNSLSPDDEAEGEGSDNSDDDENEEGDEAAREKAKMKQSNFNQILTTWNVW